MTETIEVVIRQDVTELSVDDGNAAVTITEQDTVTVETRSADAVTIEAPEIVAVEVGQPGPPGPTGPPGSGGADAMSYRYDHGERDPLGASVSYLGRAPHGSAEDAPVWTVRRVEINGAGQATATAVADGARWIDRAEAEYQ